MRHAVVPASIVALTVLAVGLSACNGRRAAAKDDRLCQSDAECDQGEICARGACVPGVTTCSSQDPCPIGLSCCGGICSHEACCEADRDCEGGYCDGGACQDGDRPACSSEQPCSSGRCLLSEGQCVECLFNDDCPIDLGCATSHECLPVGSGCTVAGCAALGQICAPEEGGCRDCISTSECGDLVCGTDGKCEACNELDDQCGPGRLCHNGECISEAGTPCQTSADCDDLVCVLVGADKQCVPCALDDECGGGRTCEADGHCSADAPECEEDDECSPPGTICQAQLCEAGCGTTGCTQGQSCNPTTGRCGGSLALGAACTSHAGCQSGVCWPYYDSQGQEQRLCSQTCARHDDCPADFVCYELGDGNLCAPTSLFTGSFDKAPGQSCTTAPYDNACASGYCNPDTDVCLEMCGSDGHCEDPALPAGSKCYSWRLLDGAITAVCDPPSASLLPAYEDCWVDTGWGGYADHNACKSGFCVQTPLPISPTCGQLCCTPADCPAQLPNPAGGTSAPICKPIDMLDGFYESGDPVLFQRVCLWREHGGSTKELGESCTQDADCKSEICVAGPSGQKRCTHTCCSNEDCAGYEWASACRPPFSPESLVGDDNADEVFMSLGRGSGFDTVGAVSPICFPK